MKIRVTSAVLSILLGSLPGLAQSQTHFETGNMLFRGLTSTGTDKAFAYGYIAGLVDEISVGASFSLSRERNVEDCIALPEGVELGQLADVVKRYLQDNPKDRHLYASFLAKMALQKAFPCKLK